jgi:hypothetical protein
MGGSKLYKNNKIIWPPNISLNFKNMELEMIDNKIFIPPIPNVGNIEDINIDNPTTFLFTKNIYYKILIDYLKSENHDLYSFAYDFRYILYEQYYTQLYFQFMNFFYKNPKSKYIIICHSLGGIIFQHFLSYCPEAYPFIDKIYFVNVPWGGTPMSFFSISDKIILKDDLLEATSSHLIKSMNKKIKTFHYFNGFFATLPIVNEPIFRKSDIWYTPQNYQLFFENDPIIKENFDLFQQQYLIKRSEKIKCPNNIVYSYGKNTTVFMDQDSKIFLIGDGDGLVPIQSLLYSKFLNYDSNYIGVSNMEHSKINTFIPVLKMFSKNIDKLNI